MKHTYCKPTTTICSVVTEKFIAASIGLNNQLGDTGVQLSRGGNVFDDDDNEKDVDCHSTFNVWD